MAAGDKKVKKSVSKSVKKNKVGGSDYTKVTKKLNKRGGVKKTKRYKSAASKASRR